MEGARTRSKQIQFHRVATRKIVYRPRENRSIELETCIYIYRFESSYPPLLLLLLLLVNLSSASIETKRVNSSRSSIWGGRGW